MPGAGTGDGTTWEGLHDVAVRPPRRSVRPRVPDGVGDEPALWTHTLAPTWIGALIQPPLARRMPAARRLPHQEHSLVLVPEYADAMFRQAWVVEAARPARPLPRLSRPAGLYLDGLPLPVEVSDSATYQQGPVKPPRAVPPAPRSLLTEEAELRWTLAVSWDGLSTPAPDRPRRPAPPEPPPPTLGFADDQPNSGPWDSPGQTQGQRELPRVRSEDSYAVPEQLHNDIAFSLKWEGQVTAGRAAPRPLPREGTAGPILNEPNEAFLLGWALPPTTPARPPGRAARDGTPVNVWYTAMDVPVLVVGAESVRPARQVRGALPAAGALPEQSALDPAAPWQFFQAQSAGRVRAAPRLPGTAYIEVAPNWHAAGVITIAGPYYAVAGEIYSAGAAAGQVLSGSE